MEKKERDGLRKLNESLNRAFSNMSSKRDILTAIEEQLKKCYPETVLHLDPHLVARRSYWAIRRYIKGELLAVPAHDWEATEVFTRKKKIVHDPDRVNVGGRSDKPENFREIGYGWTQKLNALDAEIAALREKKRKAMKKAFADGKPISWEKLLEINKLRKKLRKDAGFGKTR